MVNTDQFIKRLEKVMQFYQLNASALADKLDIQRSSISHILSGRNKPSLDLIIKIITSFSDIDFYWLVFGKGDFPKKNESVSKPILENTAAQTEVPLSSPVAPISPNIKNDEVEKIVYFFTDGSFVEYFPR